MGGSCLSRSPWMQGRRAGAAPPGPPAGVGARTLTLFPTARAACQHGCACQRAWRCRSAPSRPSSRTRATRTRAPSLTARPAWATAPGPRRTRPRSRPHARPCAACARRPRCGASCWPRSPLRARPRPGLCRLAVDTDGVTGAAPGHAPRHARGPCPNNMDADGRASRQRGLLGGAGAAFACTLCGSLAHGCSLRASSCGRLGAPRGNKT